MVFELVFNSFLTLAVVVDLLGLAPIFAALTRGYPEKRKREAAVRGTLVGALILFVSPSRGLLCSALWAPGSRRSGSRAGCCCFFWRWI